MLTSCIKNKTKSLFLPKRFVYNKVEKQAEIETTSEGMPAGGTLIEKYPKYPKLGTVGANIGTSIEQTARNLDKLMDKNKVTIKALTNALREGLRKKITESNGSTNPETLLQSLKNAGYNKIKIVKKGGNWIFDLEALTGIIPISAEGKEKIPATKPALKKTPEAQIKPGEVLIEKTTSSLSKVVPTDPKDGDRVLISRYGEVGRARAYYKKGGARKSVTQFLYIYSAEKKKFFREGTNFQLTQFIEGDVVKYERASRRVSPEKPLKMTYTINGQKYTRVGRKRLHPGQPPNYAAIATEVYKGGQLTDAAIAAAIKKSGLSITEYATLLEKGHAAAGNGKTVPVLMPREVRGKAPKGQKRAEKVEAEKVAAKTKGKDLAIRNRRHQLAIADIAKLGEDIPSEGRERGIDAAVVAVLQNPEAWAIAWKNGTLKGVKLIKNILKSSSIFGQYKSNPESARDRIYAAITRGSDELFYSIDLVKALGIKLPKNYDTLLKYTQFNPNTSPEARQYYERGAKYTLPIEELVRAVSSLRMGSKEITKKAAARDRQFEQAPDTWGLSTRNMKKLIRQLGPESTGRIYRMYSPHQRNLYCDITYKGRKASIVMDPSSGGLTGTWEIYITRPSEKHLFKTRNFYYKSDMGDLNAEDHIKSMRDKLMQLPKIKEYKGVNAQTVDINMRRHGNKFVNIQKLEQLSSQVKQLGVISLAEITVEKEKHPYIKKARKVAKALGVSEGNFWITPEGMKDIIDNAYVSMNVKYHGRNLTIQVRYDTVAIASDFNKTNFDKATKVDGPWDTSSSKFKKEFNQAVAKLPTTTTIRSSRARPEETGILPAMNFMVPFNQALTATTGTPLNNLNFNQMMELVFSLYSFEELKQQGCIKQATGHPNRFLLTHLPRELTKAPLNPAIIMASVAIKHPNSTKAVQNIEKGQDFLNKNKKYLRNLYKIFPGISRITRDGKRLSKEEIEATGQITPATTDNIFLKHYSDNAAWSILYDRITVRNTAGQEVIDPNKANIELNKLYQRGVQNLDRMTNRKEPYLSAWKTLNQRQYLRKNFIDINQDLHEWYIPIIKLGFVKEEKEREANQMEKINKLKSEIADELYGQVVDDAIKADPSITAEQVKVALKKFPVGILLSYHAHINENGDINHTAGINIPITLPINENWDFTIIPGINSKGQLGLAVGLTTRYEVHERVAITGGVAIGATIGGYEYQGENTGAMGPSIGATAGVGIEFKVHKADYEHAYNHYLGVDTGIGIGLNKQGAGIILGVGPYYRWKIDAQKRFDSEMDKEFAKHGIRHYVDLLSNKDSASKKQLTAKIRKDAALIQRLNLARVSPPPSDEVIIAAFKGHVSEITDNFCKEFDLPTIVGGRIEPAAIFLTFGLAFLFGLEINIGKTLSLRTDFETKQAELELFENMNVADKLDQSLAESFKDSKHLRKELDIGGKHSLDIMGRIRTSPSSGQIENMNVGENILQYNQELMKIGLILKKDHLGKIYIDQLGTKNPENLKIMVGKDLAVYENGALYLKNPNLLNNLYFYRRDRYYPFQTETGASKESIIMISSNRFFTPKGKFRMPTEVVLSKQWGQQRFIEEQNNSTGTAAAYKESMTLGHLGNLQALKASNNGMDDALGGKPALTESVREDLVKKEAPKIYKWRDSKRRSFLSITNQDAQEAIKKPGFEKQTLFAFFKEYAVKNKIPGGFNGREMEKLLIECSTLRYTKLYGSEREKYHKRLEWARDVVLKPAFEERIKKLQKEGFFQETNPKTKAATLAQKAIDDLWNLSPKQKPQKLAEGTSIAVALGKGANGLHQLLNGGNVDNPYGYIMGKDYTEALRSGLSEDYELALLLHEQMSPLPAFPIDAVTGQFKPAETREFMNSPIARKIASLHHLIFVLGKENYDKIVEYYKNPNITPDNTVALSHFMGIVKTIRDAQTQDKDAVAIQGAYGLNYIFTLSHRIQTGIFNECANFTEAYIDEIGILPPLTPKNIARIAVGRGESRTTATTTMQHEFMSLWGGVVAAGTFTPPEETPPGEPEPEGGPGGKTGGKTGRIKGLTKIVRPESGEGGPEAGGGE